MRRIPIELDPKALGATDAVAPRSCWHALGHVFDALDSTMLKAQSFAQAGAPHGTWVMARAQTAGRGRLGRSWQSCTDAGVYITFVLRPAASMPLGGLPLVFGMAALKAVSTVLKAQGVLHHPKAPLGLKWPNDVMAHGRKLGGILIEADGIGAAHPVLRVGIGLNVAAAAGLSLAPDIAARYIGAMQLLPENAADKAKAHACRAHLGTPRLWVDALCQALVGCVYTAYDNFCAAGLGPTLNAWPAYDTLVGRKVSAQHGETRIVGEARGVGPDGRLQLHTAQGCVWVDSGEVLAYGAAGQARFQTDLTQPDAAVYVGLTPEAP